MRLVGEILGSVFLVGAHFPTVFCYFLGGSLRPLDRHLFWYTSAIVLGYVALAILGRGLARGFAGSRRTLFDLFLLTFAAAAGVTLGLLALNLPIRLEGWDGHGFGASGSEANAMFLPWIHAALWLVAVKVHSDRAWENRS